MYTCESALLYIHRDVLDQVDGGDINIVMKSRKMILSPWESPVTTHNHSVQLQVSFHGFSRFQIGFSWFHVGFIGFQGFRLVFHGSRLVLWFFKNSGWFSWVQAGFSRFQVGIYGHT